MAEKEYIEREAIEKAFAEEIRTNYLDDYAKRFQAALLAIMSIPTADVVEVVRCKDCKWYKESKLLEPNKFCFRLKDRNGDPIGYNFSSNEFCSFGERKELDNDT